MSLRAAHLQQSTSACAFRFRDERGQLFSEGSGDSLCNVEGRLPLPALQETDVSVMNTRGLSERFLGEPLPNAVPSYDASERPGELRWTADRNHRKPIATRWFALISG